MVMSLWVGMAASALLNAAPGTPVAVPPAAQRMQAVLGTDARLQWDADGTVTTAVGFRHATGITDPVMAARAFLSRAGASLVVRDALAVSRVQKVSRGHVVRFHEVLDGLPVVGAGVAVMVEDGGTVTMALRARRAVGDVPAFRLSALEAADAALRHRPALMPLSITRDAVGAMARAVLWALDGGQLVPAYLVNLPSVDVGAGVRLAVDARDGSLLQKLPLALAENVPGRAYDPNPGADGMAPPVDVTLEVNQDTVHLRGDLMETFNCCKRTECVEQGDGGCARLACVSGLDTDAGVPSRVAFALPTSLLPIPPELSTFCTIPDPLYVDSVFCTALPRATRTDGGFVFEPLDKSTPAADARRSEEDPFAEVQAYHQLHTFQEHIRAFSGDTDFCLASQDCAGGVAQNPFHVEVNSLLPEINQAAFQGIACQVCAIPGVPGCGGRGGSPSTPVTINNYMRMDNAFFQPAADSTMSPLPVDIPGLVTPFDRIVFFQGTTRDFAYDGDVVFHEFGHAIIHTIVQNGGMPAGLNGYIRDAWGVRNEAGALNEGTADYFSQSLTEDPVTGEYAAAGLVQGELGIRNAGETWTCPDSTTGQVHDDSRAWSSALWAAHVAVAGSDTAKQRRMDDVIFTVTSALPADASFTQAASAARAALKMEFPEQAAAVDAAFDSRGVENCTRYRHVVRDNNGTLVTSGVEYLQFAGISEAGLQNHAPGHMQLRMDLPAGTLSFRLRFTAQGGGVLGGILGGGQEDNDIEVVLKADEPIINTYANNRAAHDGLTETVTPNDQGAVDVTLDVAGGAGLPTAKTYYVGFNVLAANGVTVRDIAVSVTRATVPDAGTGEPDAGGTGSSSSGGASSSSSGGGGGGDAPADECACADAPSRGVPAAGLVLGVAFMAARRRRRG